MEVFENCILLSPFKTVMAPLPLPLTRRLLLLSRCYLTSIRSVSSNDVASHSRRAPPRLQRPPPGRLTRAPRDSTSTTANKNSARNEAEDAKNARIEDRKKAIERRRILLEKGVTPPAPATQELITVIYEQKDDEVPSEASSSVEQKNQSVSNPPRPARSSVHSLNKGRKLSAADLHRLQRTSQRSELNQQAQPTQPVQKVQQVQQSKVEHRLQRSNRTNPTGGSIVAAQSATARYRMQRQQQKENVAVSENNLKTNPSVISIPIDENATAPPIDGFEERLKKLRREKQKEEKEDSTGWFSWLWRK